MNSPIDNPTTSPEELAERAAHSRLLSGLEAVLDAVREAPTTHVGLIVAFEPDPATPGRIMIAGNSGQLLHLLRQAQHTVDCQLGLFPPR